MGSDMPCMRCGGDGRIHVQGDTLDAFYQDECPECDGKGIRPLPAPAKKKTKRTYPETEAQIDTVSWLRKRDDVLVMRLENALRRDGAQQARDGAMGMLAGAPDLVLACRGRIVFVEMKAPKGDVSDAQGEVHRVLRAMGHTVLVCYGFEDAVKQLTCELDRFTTTGSRSS